MAKPPLTISTLTRLMLFGVLPHLGPVEFGGEAPPAGSHSGASMQLFQFHVDFELSNADLALTPEVFEKRFVSITAGLLAGTLTGRGMRTSFLPQFPPAEKCAEYLGAATFHSDGLAMRGLLSMTPIIEGRMLAQNRMLARFDVIGSAYSLAEIKNAA